MDKSNSFQWWKKLSLPSRLLLVGLTAPILVLNFWAMYTISHYFGALVGILIIASLLSFLLNYPVSWIEQHGGRREPASIVVFLLAISLLVALGLTLVPAAIAQAQQLAIRLPDLIESGRQQLIALSQRTEDLGFPIDLDPLSAQLIDRLKEQLQALTKELFNLAVGTVSSVLDVLVDVVITIVLTFYLLQHGDELWQSLVSWLPPRVQEPFSRTLRLSFQNYFIGQLILSSCMVTALIPTFLVLKVPFGIFFGLTIGMMALVPFGGSVGIALVTLLVALQNVWLGLKVLGAAIVVQQVLENLIAPRIIGSFTGLNPVWVFIAILTGAKVGGLLGVVVAVPSAVVIKTALTELRSRMDFPDTDIDVLPLEGMNLEVNSPKALPPEERSQVSQV
jgi:predicted PurR-regulated permease PerM